MCAIGTDVGGGTGFGMLKEGLQAHLMQRVAADGMNLDPARLCYLVTLAGAEAVGVRRRRSPEQRQRVDERRPQEIAPGGVQRSAEIDSE